MVHKSSALAAGTGGGTGGGTVSDITSTGNTLTVTNPTGPTTNIDANLATSSAAGIVKPDNSTITISGGIISAVAGGAGTVTNVSGVTANGFAFSITNPQTTPAITLIATPNGVLQGNGTAISAITTGGIATSLLSSNSLAVSGVSGVTGGGIVALGSSVTLGMADQMANTLAGYNSSGVFSDVSIGSNLSLSGGILNGTVGPAPVTSVFSRTGAVAANYGDYAFNLISGVASVSQGGTGLQTLSSHGVLLGEGISNVGAATTGIAGRLLFDQGSLDPAFEVVSGDVSALSTGAFSVLQVHGVAYPASPSTNTVPVVTGSNQITYEQVPNAALLNSAITVSAGTGLTGGGSVPLGGSTTLSLINTSVTVSGVSGVTGGGAVALGSSITIGMADSIANTLAGYNNSGVFSDVSIGSNLSLSSGVLNGAVGPAPVTSVFSRIGAVTPNWNDYQFNLIGGIASVSQGGTGVQTLSAHGVLLGEGTGNISAATTGTVGRLLIDQGSGNDPAFKIISGDAIIASTGAITLATVNSNVGTFGSSSLVPSATVNGKGLVTSISASTVTAPASLITGSTLASNVTASSLTTTGALASGSLASGFTIVTPALGGTGVNNSSATGVAQWSNGSYSVSTGLFNGTTAITQTAGDNSTKVATDAFVTTAVNNAIAGVNPAVAVQAATTAAGDTSGFTYNNGVSGIGATFTGSVSTAVTIDGFTFTALGQRLLVKNDTQSPSGAFNGIYYVTQLQTGILPPILTRVLDYDQPSDINNTGAIPVINGTVNAQTSWVETATVNTVGTDPLSFTKFSINPTTILTNSLTSSHIFVGNGSNIATDTALTGDASINSAGSISILKVNAVSYPASPGTNTVPVVTSSNVVTYETVPNAALTNAAITIGAQTGLAGGGSVALGAAITLSIGTSTANTLAGYNSSGVFSDVGLSTDLGISNAKLFAFDPVTVNFCGAI